MTDQEIERLLAGSRPGWATDADVLLAAANGRDGYEFETDGFVDLDLARGAINQALADRTALLSEIARLRERVGVLTKHIAEQIPYVEARIQDGKEIGAAAWRIALEDVASESRALLNTPTNEGDG